MNSYTTSEQPHMFISNCFNIQKIIRKGEKQSEKTVLKFQWKKNYNLKVNKLQTFWLMCMKILKYLLFKKCEKQG